MAVGAHRHGVDVYPTAVRVKALRLIEEGQSLNAVSKQLGVSRAALREWRANGIDPRGRLRTCFACDGRAPSNGPAYAALFGYYLGDGCISRVGRTFSLRVSCDREYPAIVAAVGRAMESVHEGGRVCHVRGPGVIVVQNCWNHWPCAFPQHGPGRKHERTLTLEEWQRQIITAHPGRFLRGLFHSDGCRSNNWTTRMVAGVKKRYDYPRWQFVNHSSEIRQWCTEALDILGIAWRQSRWNCISVSTRPDVARLDEIVGLKC